MFLNQIGQSKVRRYSMLVAAGVLLANLSVIFFIDEGSFKTILIDLGFPLWYMLAALALFYGARQTVHHSRQIARAWAVLGLAELSLGIGSAIWVYLELSPQPLPFPSLADVFYLAAYPLFLLGIGLFPSKHLSKTEALKIGFDMTIVLLLATITLWYYWLSPLLATIGDASLILKFVALAYPVGDLVVFLGILLLLYRQLIGQTVPPLLLLAAGTGFMLFSDINYGYQGIHGANASAAWLDLGWVLSGISYGLAGIWLATSLQSAQPMPSGSAESKSTLLAKLNRWTIYLPYACVIAAFILFQQTHAYNDQPVEQWVTQSEGLIIGLVIIRQIVTLYENSLLFAQVQEKGLALAQKNQELQEAQSMLIHSEKMNALGQLVAGVAHEINNPVAFVNSNIHALKEAVTDVITAYGNLEQLALATGPAETQATIMTLRKEADIDFLREDLDDLVDTSLHGLTRVRKIVESLRNFSRLDEADYQWADLREGIESSLVIAQPATKKRIQIELAMDNLPLFYCRPAELNQVFLNLILNAIHAIDDKGAITITGQDTEHAVILTFCDTGCGMSQKVMQDIFNPFFTTKPIGVGTGLGLSIAYKIITAGHGGTIDVASEPGSGTTFTIRLPKEQQA